jgi:DNA-binding response OmpR family regulator
MSAMDSNARINLSKANVLLIDVSQHSLGVMAQIVKGFGVADACRCIDIEEADKHIRNKIVDIIIIDPDVDNGAGYEFVKALRHSGGANAHVTVILVSGHVRAADVARARDTGANFFVAKPLTPNVLLQRILFVSRDKRDFVEFEDYIGPSWRFKFAGPPTGSDGRRDGDLKAPLGGADEPNLSQNEIDNFIKPQRVLI